MSLGRRILVGFCILAVTLIPTGIATAAPSHTTQKGCDKAAVVEHGWQAKHPKATKQALLTHLRPVAEKCTLTQLTHYSVTANKGKKLTKAQARDLQGVATRVRVAYPHSPLGRSVGKSSKVSQKSPKTTAPPTPAPPPPTTVYAPPPTTVYVPPPPPTTIPPPTVPPTTIPLPTSPTASCSPTSNEGTCYEPGEFCRDSDHGLSGIAGDGKEIVCEDNDGWRWEPTS